MRRVLLLSVLAVIASAVVAYSLPRATGEASAPSSAAQAGVSERATSVPVVIATGVTPRSLAISSFADAREDSAGASLYLTVADQPYRLFALSLPGAFAPLAASAATRLVPFAGIAEAGSLGDGGAAALAQFDLKLDSQLMRSGVAVASDGTLFVADTRNATIRRIAGPASTEPGIVRSLLGRWGPRQNIELVEPMGISLDRAGNLCIADHGANQVLLLRAAVSQTPAALEMLAHVAQPSSISIAPDGSKLFVASPEKAAVFVVDTRSREIRALAGDGGEASACSGPAIPRGRELSVCPAGLAVDGGGNIFIADAAANRILRVDAGSAATTIAASQLSSPGEIKFDAGGNLFVAEQGRNRVLEFRNLGQAVSAVTLSPVSNDFGVEPVGGTSPAASFTLANGTSAALSNLTFNNFVGLNSSDFQTQASSCTSTLAVNASCTIDVVFVPSAVRTRSSQFVVSYAGAPPLTAAVTGTGAEYQITLVKGQDASATVVAGDKVTYNLQITPDANFPANSPYTFTFVSPPIATPGTTIVPAGELPALTQSSFSPASMSVTPGTAVPFTFTIETTSRITGMLGSVPAGPGGQTPDPLRPPLFPALALAAALAVYLAARAVPARSAIRLRFGSMALLFLAAGGMIGGCGGGGRHPIIGTQPGTTNFIIQATVQNAQGTSLNVARGIPLQIVVQ